MILPMDTVKDLNPQQQKAVEHVEGPLLLIAGAGSGKTSVVTYRIAHLLNIGVPATEILAVTFTNKAAQEMRERIHKLAHASILTCTFHSLCARILRESIEPLGFTPHFTIFDEEDSEKVVRECFTALNQKEEKGALKAMRSQISQAKNNMLEPEDLSNENPFFNEVYRLYQARLKEYNALDFDDLLFQSVKLFRLFPDILAIYQKRWSFILIDEYQDTNAAQHLLVKLLSLKHQNVFAVGDPDQSIYSWRGADIQHILNFEKDFTSAKILSLEQNYRSKTNILQAANALIENNAGRYEKKLWSDKGTGEKIGLFICDDDRKEADFVVKQLLKHHEEQHVPFSSCAIFYRTNFQSRTFEDALLKARIPYVIIGGLSFYQRREIKDILSFLRIVLAGSDFLSFSRTVNLPKRGLGDSFLNKLRAFSLEQTLDIFTTSLKIVEKKLEFKLTPKQQQGLVHYVQLICALREMVKLQCPLHEIISETIDRSGYLEFLKEDPESYDDRRSNLQELVAKAAQWEQEAQKPSLISFLEELSLKGNQEEKGSDEECVRLMTFHNGKGLEFDVVFLVGMEEDLFPHLNAKESEASLEEERRLCYVGMTRAKEHLYLSASRMRFLWGGPRLMRPSRFLLEIPAEYLHAYHRSARSIENNEEPFNETDSPFQNGDSVLHKDFGVGTVQKSYQTSLGLTYDVYFPNLHSTRSLIAKYAKLKKESSTDELK